MYNNSASFAVVVEEEQEAWLTGKAACDDPQLTA